MLLSGTTLLVIVIATAVSYSLVKSGKKIDVIGDVRAFPCLLSVW